jgi:adenylosuccinate synthase
MQFNGPNLTLTKVDVLSRLAKIKLAVKYKYTGPEIFYAGQKLSPGDEIDFFPRFSEILYDCQPIYQEFDGWKSDISQLEDYDQLPEQVKKIINFIEDYTSGKIDVVSVGPDRGQTIFKL